MKNLPGSPSRREVIQAGIAGTFAAGLGSETLAQEIDNRYKPFRMGFQSYTMRGYSLDEALAMTKKFGIGFWESFPAHVPPDLDPAKAAAMLAKLKASNVKLAAYGVVGFDKDEAKARKSFDFAKLMGFDTLSADPTPDSFDMLDKLVEEYKVNIAIHNHGPEGRYNKISDTAKAIEGHHPRIGACVDTGHYLRGGEDPVLAVRTFGARTYGCHLKDVKGKNTFTILGEGDLDTVGVLRALREVRFKGIVALEYEEHEKDVAPYVDLCLQATRSAISKLKGQG
jgi:sugar phosphate isomerase/epimerase